MQRRRRRAHPALALALVALFAALGANGSARAQTDPAELADQFGGYRLSTHGNAILFAFDAVGFVPGNPRVFQQGLPEAQATGASGPSFYGLASLDYPGSVIGNLGAIAAQGGGGDAAGAIPGYPIQVEAASPGETPQAQQGALGTTMGVVTTGSSSDSVATFDGNDLPQFLHSTGMAVHANTHLEQGRAVSLARSEMSGIDFAGILHIGSAVTDIRADTDGTTGASSGGTVLSDAAFLGLPAVIDATGIHLVPGPGSGATPTTKPGPLAPIVDPIASKLPLSGLSTALQGVASGLSTLLTTTVGVTGTINDLLAEGGIKIHVLEPTHADNGAVGSLAADGVAIEMTYNSSTNAVLSQLFALAPVQQGISSLPSDSLIPQVPINTSPQGLVSLLQQVYGMTIMLVPAAVQSEASPPFEFSPTSPTGIRPTTPLVAPSTGGSTTPGFATAAPSLTRAPANSTGGTPAGTIAEAVPISFVGDAIPVWAAILLLLSMPLWAALSSKLADRTLAAVSTSCPLGADGPPPPGGTA